MNKAAIINNEELKQRLLEAGSTGLDLSPGDPLALEAYKRIVQLENLLDGVKRLGSLLAEARLWLPKTEQGHDLNRRILKEIGEPEIKA